ncbi:glycoside hydrolase family 5 protein [Iamia sp. SCSIO 61187]|uniref:glycoside hydrolase family 5 protein n=1 Tax=Iamia sp. SCSIO 61187 TaxID=2722752 RepID=UPI001C62BF4F|nr:cellulase family glycosylhydrolase [Iamia sp. SCSIO 61187]QYG93108.1 glycoside hydrolase family 5 protein [Iamia sp. SCSIO 61187]
MRTGPHPRPRRRGRAALVRIALVLAVVATGACTDDDDGGTPPDEGAPATAVDDRATTASGALPELTPVRVASVGGRRVFVDGTGRQVLLRGANLSSLVDYHQADPALAPTRPPTDDDWDAMAAHGFGVVRLLVSWSAIEPVRGQIDPAYVERITAAVEAAAARRIYTVIDMHQDAWSKFIATPPGTVCPPLTEPAIGWDGAPQWATLTDGADTCRPLGDRDGSPAVRAAFTAFYENREGIRDAFVATWRQLVAALGPTPAVVGYDLLNEPSPVDPFLAPARYTELLQAALAQVRAGEADAGAPARVVFVEPLRLYPQPGQMPADPLALDDQLAFAPHADVGAATGEEVVGAGVATAAERGWPLWVGEHGVAGVDEASRDLQRRFAAAQDDAVVGGAHWQWRQWCGDPHALGVPGGVAAETQVQLNDVACPADADTGPNEELLRVVGRAYPRAAPGRITDLASDADRGTLTLHGVIEDDLATGRDLVVWIPGEERPDVTGDGLGEPALTPVPGGWYATVEVVDSPYELEVR